MIYWFLRGNITFSKKIVSAFFLLSLFCAVPISALANPQESSAQQKMTVTGVVIDALGEPLIGVNVVEQGTPNGVATDFDGAFSISVTDGAKLSFSYIGYNELVLPAKSSPMKVTLLEDSKLIEEVVVVGYGAQKKESVVGSITQVKGDVLKSKGAVSNITDALSGSMPGVTVMTSSGNPGGGGEFGEKSTILIRGMNTWNNAQPLVLVDGIERDMNDVDVNEIENFSVLKDASATAVFGVKGANGVILITTKRGQVGKARVSFEANVACKSLSDITQPVDSYDALVARNFSVVNELPRLGSSNWSYYTSNRMLEMFRTGVDPEKYPNVDWRDVMLNDQAISQKYNLNISGGTDFVKYFTSIGYVREGDILATNEGTLYDPEFRYDRFNFRTNLDFNITKSTTFRVNLGGYYGKQQTPACGIHNMWYSLYKYDPAGYLPVYEDGTFGFNYTPSDRIGNNGYFDMYSSGTKVYNRTSVTSDFELNQKLDFITKGLSIKGKFSYDNYFTSLGSEIKDASSNYVRKYWDRTNNEWVYEYPVVGKDGFDFYPEPLGYTAEYLNAGQANNTLRNMYYEVAINYNRTFGDHTVGALALFSRQENAKGSAWASKREDWVGRITYDYKGKYLFETNGAYNGSEKFGPDYRFDFFPSLALGWRVSEEKFIKNTVLADYITNFKIKYSIGLIGNDNLNGVGQWPFVTTWNEFATGGHLFPGGSHNTGRYPNFGTDAPQQSIYPIVTEGTPGNPDLRWETAQKQNLGVELVLLNGLIMGNLDLFKEHRYDMLVGADQRSIPDFFGQTPPAANIGEVKSKGMELDVKVQKRFGDWNVWGSYNWTVAKNQIIYKEDPEMKPFYQKAAGYSIGQVKTNPVTGIVQSWDDMYTHVNFQNSASNDQLTPGSYVLTDFNGNGMVDDNDGAPYGYSNYPQNTYGFAVGADWKGIALRLQFYGAYNVSINCGEFHDEFAYSAALVYPELIDRTWTPEYGNDNPDYRAFQSHGQKTPTGSSGIYDGSYLRLKTAELSYTLPKKILQKISMESIRIYVNGNNLFFWSDLPVDIEGKNFSLKSYPTTKQVNFGLNVTF